jgi:predicted RNA binding protein YcfA (HicA-like mRNA interferase family)
MVTRDFSGSEVVAVLQKFGYRYQNQSGSHVKLRYEHPSNPDDIRVVSVPMHDRISIGTLQSIADQCGADDFHAWCAWIDAHR